MSEVRLITPITRQSTKKMQVAAYCRVSSNSADQLNSYAAQIRAYKKLIGERDDWELVDIFADEGLTGMKSETRDEDRLFLSKPKLFSSSSKSSLLPPTSSSSSINRHLLPFLTFSWLFLN